MDLNLDLLREVSFCDIIEFDNAIFNYAKNRFTNQNTAYPTPKPKGNMIQGRHNGVSLNFQAKIPTARTPNIIPMILGNIIDLSASTLCICKDPSPGN